MSLSKGHSTRTMKESRKKSVAGPVVVGALLFGVVLIVGVFFGLWWRRVTAPPELNAVLKNRGTLLAIGEKDFAGWNADGTITLSEKDNDFVSRLLSGEDEEALAQALLDQRITGVLAGPLQKTEQQTLRDRFVGYAPMQFFHAELISKDAALYLLSYFPKVDEVTGEALATLARRLLEGESPPPLQTFPETLRDATSVEIMVLLRDGTTARLWRSARGSSVARALITATLVAADRWKERENAMGGALTDKLEELDVEVWRLFPDGYLEERDAEFVNSVFYEEHGVAYEKKTSWRYMLPESREKLADSSATAAFKELFESSGQSPNSLDRRDLRPYRLRAERLGTSEALLPGSINSTE
ncbi:MAG: hypothetical protein IPJ88_17045 [Myxococcales bacterium]|nr:MAG: hypothetical protein IPJ88_17045 [Myxococcales bacterium]